MSITGKTVLALAATAVLVAVTGALAVAIHHSPHRDPQITAYAHGRSVAVPPYRYCTLRAVGPQLFPDCHESAVTVALPTPPGSVLQLSLPRSISSAPWLMVLEYAMPDGGTVRHLSSYREYPARAMALTIPTRPQPQLRLVGVEVQLVVPTRDEAGAESFRPYQAWSIATA